MSNLKELSQLLGLSQTTVSRALNGYPEVSEETRRRVIIAAKEHKYTPNPSARGLATGHARVIGHVVPLSSHDMINPHFSDFIAGAGMIYQQRGYDMLISVCESHKQEDAYRKFKRDRRVDGVIVHGPLANDPRIELLQFLEIPFVVHGRTLGDTDSYCWVDVNNRRAFLHATDYLVELGHRHIGLINGLENMVFAIKRREGMEHSLAKAGLTLDPEAMKSADMTEPYGYQAMRQLLQMPHPPTAVLCASMLPAMGAMRAIQEAGLQPGKDISLIAYDDALSFLSGQDENHSITVMRSGIRDAGKECAEMLIDLIEGKEGTVHKLLEAQFVVGSTTGPAPKR